MDPRLCNVDHKLKYQTSLNPLDLINDVMIKTLSGCVNTNSSLQMYLFFVIVDDSQMTSQINNITVQLIPSNHLR